MFNWFAQVSSVTGLNIRNLPARWGSSLVAVVGIAGVVMIVVGILSIAGGLISAMSEKAPPDNVMVMRASSTSELDSIILRDDALVIEQALEATGAGGSKLISPEVFVVVDVMRKSSQTASNVVLRGVESQVLSIRDNVKVVEGRMLEPGLNEIVVGTGAREIFDGLELGAKKAWGSNEWTVVGIIDSNGGVPDSEVWADLRVLQAAQNRGSVVQVVRVKVQSDEAYQAFRDSLTSDPRLSVSVQTENEFYASQSRMLGTFISSIGVFVGILMGLGAVFGAIITMYTAVAARTAEIATLRALGFGASPVVISVLIESLAIGLVGGLLGAAFAYLIFNGFQVSTLNYQSFSQISFGFQVTQQLLVLGVIYSLIIGFIGGLLPSIRAARLSVSTALREL